MNVKKLFLLNLPYLLFVYPFDMTTKLGETGKGENEHE